MSVVQVERSANATLALARHAESRFNLEGLWTGRRDPGLTAKGFADAVKAAEVIRDINFNRVYVSTATRTRQTYEKIEDTNELWGTPVFYKDELQERDYGDYTGKNKWAVRDEVGEELFQKIRRSWDHPIPNGESMKMVYERVVPFYEKEIKPCLMEGENVLVVAHGNSLRALSKHLDNLTDDQLADLEIEIGQVIVYSVDPNGQIVPGSRDVRHAG